MFIDNKYRRYYFSIIQNAQNSNRKRSKGEYFESHHIHPRSLGGTDHADNLVLLTAREHFICHRLLVKITHGTSRQKMSYAMWGMVNKSNKFQQRHNPNSRTYSTVKQDMQKSLSEARTGKTIEELWGDEIASKIRETYIGRRKRSSPSPQERQQISDRVRTASANTPWKRNFQMNRLPTCTCAHCGRTMDKGNYTRHHGDNCKLRPPSILPQIDL